MLKLLFTEAVETEQAENMQLQFKKIHIRMFLNTLRQKWSKKSWADVFGKTFEMDISFDKIIQWIVSQPNYWLLFKPIRSLL